MFRKAGVRLGRIQRKGRKQCNKFQKHKGDLVEFNEMQPNSEKSFGKHKWYLVEFNRTKQNSAISTICREAKADYSQWNETQ